MDHTSFQSWSRRFIVAHRVNMEQRLQHELFLQRMKRERNQQDATNLMFIIKLLCQHVSGIIMPIFRRTRLYIAAYGVLHWL